MIPIDFYITNFSYNRSANILELHKVCERTLYCETGEPGCDHEWVKCHFFIATDK